MDGGRLIRERYELSCRTLIRLIAQEEDDDTKLILLDDFISKSKNLSSEAWRFATLEALKPFLPVTVQERLQSGGKKLDDTRRHVDVAVVNVMPVELFSTKIAFEIDPSRHEDERVHGLRLWKTIVPSDASEEGLSIVLTMVGEAGNVSCAAACDRLFNAYKIDLCILVGIAAGLKEKVALGDVVAAELVLDYEYGRLEPTGLKKRPRPFNLDVRIARDLNYYVPHHLGWHDHLQASLGRLRSFPFDKGLHELAGPQWVPKYHKGVILAGEKLIADGSLPQMQIEYHDRVRAGEMESAGFARMCDEHNVPWLVFRGVSDYGDPDKSDEWQTNSALAAASVAKVFMSRGYRKPEQLF